MRFPAGMAIFAASLGLTAPAQAGSADETARAMYAVARSDLSDAAAIGAALGIPDLAKTLKWPDLRPPSATSITPYERYDVADSKLGIEFIVLQKNYSWIKSADDLTGPYKLFVTIHFKKDACPDLKALETAFAQPAFAFDTRVYAHRPDGPTYRLHSFRAARADGQENSAIVETCQISFSEAKGREE